MFFEAAKDWHLPFNKQPFHLAFLHIKPNVVGIIGYGLTFANALQWLKEASFKLTNKILARHLLSTHFQMSNNIINGLVQNLIFLVHDSNLKVKVAEEKPLLIKQCVDIIWTRLLENKMVRPNNAIQQATTLE